MIDESVKRAFFVGFAALLCLGCEKRVELDVPGPLAFEVDITAGDAGTEEAPLPFSKDPLTVELSIFAIDRDGSLATWFDDEVSLRIEPRGSFPLEQPRTVRLEGGVASAVQVGFQEVHSTASIWVEHIGDDDAPGSYATGLSPVIWASNPTIRDIQEVDAGKHLTSALRKDFVEIDLEDRTAVVTGVMSDGYYVTDVSEPDFAYSSIYVYSHNHPDVEVGDRVVQLNGTVDEFYGFTELSFPAWRVGGAVDPPQPVAVTAAIVDDDDAMERYESALVEVENAVVCPMGDDFATYGQWALLIDPGATCGGETGKINVVSAFTVPDFAPPEHVGETLPAVRGDLRYHAGATPSWIIYARGPQDIEEAGGE